MTNDDLNHLLGLRDTYLRRIRIAEQLKAVRGADWHTDDQLVLDSDLRSFRLVEAQLKLLQTPIDPVALLTTSEEARFLTIEWQIESLADLVGNAMKLFQRQITAEQQARIKGQWVQRIILGLLASGLLLLVLR